MYGDLEQYQYYQIQLGLGLNQLGLRVILAFSVRRSNLRLWIPRRAFRRFNRSFTQWFSSERRSDRLHSILFSSIWAFPAPFDVFRPPPLSFFRIFMSGVLELEGVLEIKGVLQLRGVFKLKDASSCYSKAHSNSKTSRGIESFLDLYIRYIGTQKYLSFWFVLFFRLILLYRRLYGLRHRLRNAHSFRLRAHFDSAWQCLLHSNPCIRIRHSHKCFNYSLISQP